MKYLTCLAVLVLTAYPCLGCTNGDLRLTGSSSGVLQICKNTEWRIVCSEDWGHLDAAVACRQLGYDSGYAQSSSSSNRIRVDPVEYHCNGRESNLQDCQNETTSKCSSSDVVGIACVRRNVSDPCNHGDIRLWGGQTENEGNIEMCTDHGVWSGICDTYWDEASAIVACRQLNYTNPISISYERSTFGRRIQPMEYGGMDCQGRESSLHQCAVERHHIERLSTLIYCNERDYAGVKCISRTVQMCRDGEVRLTNGYSENNGFPEICIGGAWVGVCQPTRAVSMAICNQLGYPRYTRIDPSVFQANRNEPQAYVTRFRCHYGYSSRLMDCIYNSTRYGIPYRDSCEPDRHRYYMYDNEPYYGILCCPNDIASCFFQMPPSVSTPSQAETVSASPNTNAGNETAHFYLHFGTAATFLIMSLSGDLRGLEKDIQERVVHGISEECDCPFDTSALSDGSFSLGQYVTYSGKVSAVDSQSAASLVHMLKTNIEKNPLIQFRSADIHLDVQFSY